MNFWDQDDSGFVDFDEFVKGTMLIMNSELAHQVLFLKHDLHSYGQRILDKVEKIEGRRYQCLEAGGPPEEGRESIRKSERRLSQEKSQHNGNIQEAADSHTQAKDNASPVSMEDLQRLL